MPLIIIREFSSVIFQVFAFCTISKFIIYADDANITGDGILEHDIIMHWVNSKGLALKKDKKQYGYPLDIRCIPLITPANSGIQRISIIPRKITFVSAITFLRLILEVNEIYWRAVSDQSRKQR